MGAFSEMLMAKDNLEKMINVHIDFEFLWSTSINSSYQVHENTTVDIIS